MMKNITFLIMSVILLTSCTYFQNEPIPQEVVKELPKDQIFKATIMAAGDLLIHSPIYRDAKTSNGEYDFKPMFELIKPIIEKADFALVNQETTIGGEEIGLSSYPRFNSPYEVADAVQYTGFDLVSTATNHTIDRGEKAVMSAIEHYKEIGLPYVGSNVSEVEQNQIKIFNVNDIKIAVLAYSYGTNGLPVPKGKEYLVNIIDMDRMKSDIEKAKQSADVIICSVHMGTEYQPLPNTQQVELYQHLADWGVDIIFGHHPHVLQPAALIKASDGTNTVVYYSLGNFISNQSEIERAIGGIASVEIIKTVKPTGEQSIELTNVSFLPTYTKRGKDFKIIPMDQLNNNILLNYEKYYNRTITHMKQYYNNLQIINSK